MNTQILLNIIYYFCIILLISLSFSIIFRVTSTIQITHANFITLGAFFVLTLQGIQFPLLISLMGSIGICIFISILIYDSLERKLNVLKVSNLMKLIVNIGLYIVIQNITSMIWGNDTKLLKTPDIGENHEILGAYITDLQIITINVSIIIVNFCLLFLKYTKVGQRIRAVSANSELANVQGINSDRVILWATGIGSGMAAIAGILVGFDTGLTPTMGFNLLLYGIVAMIIGGVGSTKGLIGGAFLLAAAQHLTAYYIDSKWMNAITYIILIAFLIWRPLGFSGQRLKKIEI